MRTCQPVRISRSYPIFVPPYLPIPPATHSPALNPHLTCRYDFLDADGASPNSQIPIRALQKVASSADWGGQPELLALTQALGVPIRVHAAAAPPLLLGWDKAGPAAVPPLEVAYHRHYYALGEHYNSTKPMA